MTNCGKVTQLVVNRGGNGTKSESEATFDHSWSLDAHRKVTRGSVCGKLRRLRTGRHHVAAMKTSRSNGTIHSVQGLETAKNAARERTRVKSLRVGFQRLQNSLPSVPADTKLSKLDILILATNYISHLTKVLADDDQDQVHHGSPSLTGHDLRSNKQLHPIKKWPMRSRLYADQSATTDIVSSTSSSSPSSVSSEMAFSRDHHSVTSPEPLLLESNTWDILFADITFDCNLLTTCPLTDQEANEDDHHGDAIDMMDSLMCL